MNILDIAKAVSAKSEIEINGIRPGEKLHEQMISQEILSIHMNTITIKFSINK